MSLRSHEQNPTWALFATCPRVIGSKVDAIKGMRTSRLYPYPCPISGSETAASLGGDGTGLLEVVAGLEMALAVDGASEVMHHAVDLRLDLIEVPVPVATGPHPVHPPAPSLCREHRTEPVPPEPHGLIADLDTTLMREVLDVPRRQREPDVDHYPPGG